MIKKYDYKTFPLESKPLKNRSLFTKSQNTIGRVIYGDGGDVSRYGRTSVDREMVVDALEMNNLENLIDYSRHFYRTNLIYAKAIDFLADAYFYYWSLFPTGRGVKDLDEEIWWSAIDYVEVLNPEKFGPEMVRTVLVNGSYYVYIKDSLDNDVELGIQELDRNYCQVQESYNGIGVVHFNLKFFDNFRGLEKEAALEAYPKEISDAYKAYERKETKKQGEEWIRLDHKKAFRFALREDEVPYLIAMVLDTIDREDIKTLTMVKLEQELTKLLVQLFDVNKDGIATVDMTEMEIFHSNLTNLVSNIPGVDVLTTLGKIDSIDVQKDAGVAANHPLTRSTENIYDSAGVPQQLFNTGSVGGMKFSINRELGNITPLIRQLQDVVNRRLADLLEVDSKQVKMKINILDVHRYNQQEMIGFYKEQTTLGFSKFLPAIALGQRQSSVLGALEFEDNLGLRDLMNPPASSSTLSSKDSDGSVGAPEKSDDERSEKTEKNRESLVD